MTCAACGSAVGDSDFFCGSCGMALSSPVDVVADAGVPASIPSVGLATWRGGEVALGVLFIFIAIIPVFLLSAGAGNLSDRYGTAVTVWASSHLMGLVILGVVWQLVLKGDYADFRGVIGSLGLNSPRISFRHSALLTFAALASSLAATGLYAGLIRWLDLGDCPVSVLEYCFGSLAPPDIPPDFAFPGAASAFTFQALAVWTPITEEILFRGFIFAGLISRFGIRGAIVGSAVIFSVFHFTVGVLIPIFITGVLLAWLYHRTGSLWPSIAAHAGQNALALTATIFFV